MIITNDIRNTALQMSIQLDETRYTWAEVEVLFNKYHMWSSSTWNYYISIDKITSINVRLHDGYFVTVATMDDNGEVYVLLS